MSRPCAFDPPRLWHRCVRHGAEKPDRFRAGKGLAHRMTAVLTTIGYEGLALRDFVGFLRASGATRLLDLRAIPQSRKPGFSKRMLAASVAEAGIAYTHLRALGTPKAGRIAARKGDAATLSRVYEAHLATAEAALALAEAARLAGAGPCCLLCFEADPALCHRSIVADRLAGMGGFGVRHLRCF